MGSVSKEEKIGQMRATDLVRGKQCVALRLYFPLCHQIGVRY